MTDEKLKPSWFISLNTSYLRDSGYFFEEERNKYQVRTKGCDCCSNDYSLSPKEMVELIYSMIDHLNEMKENVISGRKT